MSHHWIKQEGKVAAGKRAWLSDFSEFSSSYESIESERSGDSLATSTRSREHGVPRKSRAPATATQLGIYCQDDQDGFFTDILSLPAGGRDVKGQLYRVQEEFKSQFDITDTFGGKPNQDRLPWKPTSFKGISALEIRDMEDLYVRLYGKPITSKINISKAFAWGWVLHRKLGVSVNFVSFAKNLLAQQFSNQAKGISKIRQDWRDFAKSELEKTEYRGERYPPYTTGPVPVDGSILPPQTNTGPVGGNRDHADTPSCGPGGSSGMRTARHNPPRGAGFPRTPSTGLVLPRSENPKVTRAREVAAERLPRSENPKVTRAKDVVEEKLAVIATLTAELQQAWSVKLQIALQKAIEDWKDAKQLVTVADAEAALEAGSLRWQQEEAGKVTEEGPGRDRLKRKRGGKNPSFNSDPCSSKVSYLEGELSGGFNLPGGSGGTERKVGKNGARHKFL